MEEHTDIDCEPEHSDQHGHAKHCHDQDLSALLEQPIQTKDSRKPHPSPPCTRIARAIAMRTVDSERQTWASQGFRSFQFSLE